MYSHHLRFNSNKEMTAYVIQCSETSACVQQWDKEVDKLHTWMLKKGFYSEMAKATKDNCHA